MESKLTSDEIYDFYKSQFKSIEETKRIVQEFDKEFIDHTRLNAIVEKPSFLTVVMTTTPKRQQQTLFTLKTIKRSSISDKVQIIIVEDSECGIKKEKLEAFSLFIDHIKIKNKFWINPCVNYNIGFKLALSDKIIIQNGEVCHVGDICLKAYNSVSPGTYVVFDVLALQRPQLNTVLHKRDIQAFCKTRGNFSGRNAKWYQHHKIRNANLHFLTAISSEDLKKIGGGFDLDYSMATCFDDPAFINQLKGINLKFLNVPDSGYRIMGIHQYHEPENPKMTLTNVHNQHLLYAKEAYTKEHDGEYIFLETEDALDDLFKKKIF